MSIETKTSTTDATTVSIEVGEHVLSIKTTVTDGIFRHVAMCRGQVGSCWLSLNSMYLESMEEIAAMRELLTEVSAVIS